MRDPPGATAVLGKAREGGNDGGADLHGGARRCAAFWPLGQPKIYHNQRKKGQGGILVLTEGLRRDGTRRRMVGDKGQAVETIGAHGEGRRRVLRGAGLLGSPRGFPAEVPWGLRRPAVHRRRAIVAAGSAHLRRSSGKFRPMSGPGSRVKGSGASR
jgi:hypothetical protein